MTQKGGLAFRGIPHHLGKHMRMCLQGTTSLQCVEAFSPAQPVEEQNHEGVWAPKWTISTQLGWGRYKVSEDLTLDRGARHVLDVKSP